MTDKKTDNKTICNQGSEFLVTGKDWESRCHYLQDYN